MTSEKFEIEIETLQKFFKKYCEDKHSFLEEKEYSIEYKDKIYRFEISLCNDCHNLISYSFDRLRNCPHEIKPRCRKCPNPCYEKKEWRLLAKIMRYSAIKFGLTKLKKYFF